MTVKEDQKKEDEVITTGNPLVFISHDTRDAKLAEAFSALIKSVSAGVLKSFRTSDRKGNQGIDYGVEWYPEIIKNIQEASDVVCLLTERSINRPWILFEAGMAKGKLETPILGIALGVSLKEASSGPFAQFQNCGDDEESLTKLVFQLVDRIPHSEPDEETIKFQVGKFKKAIETILEEDNKKQEKNKQEPIQLQDNSTAKLFEEIKVMFHDLPSRIQFTPEIRNRKKRRIHPKMLDEIIHTSKDSYLGIMMMLSLLRESMPWLYDIGMETARTIKDSKPMREKKRALSEFEELLDISTHHPMMRELMDNKDDYILFREIPRLLIRALNRLMMERQ